MDLEQQFVSFAKFKIPKSDGQEITLAKLDKWMKQAGIIDGKRITMTDIGICFNKMKLKAINYPQFLDYIEDLSNYKKVDKEDIMDKLLTCGSPGSSNTVRAVRVRKPIQMPKNEELVVTSQKSLETRH